MSREPSERPEPLELRTASYTDPEVRELEARVQQEYVRRYGGADSTPIDSEQFDPPDGVFLVGWAGGEPVVCGGFRRHDADSAEIKRMYVVDSHRGLGYARAVLAALEDLARAAGYHRVLLETGTEQPEALTLYASSGYTPVEGFGHYKHLPKSRSFQKPL